MTILEKTKLWRQKKDQRLPRVGERKKGGMNRGSPGGAEGMEIVLYGAVMVDT